MIDIKADEEKFNYRNRAKEVTVELLNRFDGPDDANENAEEIAKFLSYIVHELSTYNVNVPVSIRYQKSTALYNKERDEVIFQKTPAGPRLPADSVGPARPAFRDSQIGLDGVLDLADTPLQLFFLGL